MVRWPPRSGTRRDVAAPLVVVALLCAPQAAGAAAGDIDPSWASGGKFSLVVGPHASGINAAAKQADGKIVVAGFAEQAASAPFNSDFMVARLNADGTLDTSFNAGGAQPGVRTTSIAGDTADDFGNAVAIGPGGTIYVAGATDPAGTDSVDFAVVRYTSAGLEDAGFSTDGIQTLSLTNFDVARGIAVQESDGKPIVVGSSGDGFHVMRLDPTTGALDTTYNAAGATPGVQEILFGDTFQTDVASAVVLQGDGKAVVAGSAEANTTSADFALARLNTDGTLDTAGFGAGTGKVQTMLSQKENARAVALDGGKIVLAGDVLATSGPSTKDFIVARYLADGSADMFFGGSGVVTTPFIATDGTRFANATSVLVEDGKILANGTAFNCPGVGCADFAVARYSDDGSLDGSFGDAGKRTYPVGGESDFASAAVPGSNILFGWVDVGVDSERLARVMLDDGWLLAPGALFHATHRPTSLMRINFATTQDARFWRALEQARAAL